MEAHSLCCAICLERFKYPATIPCGHTFCKDCISKHWDQREKGRPQHVEFNCPVCNEKFPTRPSLKRNVSLSVLSEAAADSGGDPKDAGSPCERADVGTELLCARHQKPLDVYCRNERMCVCCACAMNECKNHDKVLVEEERSNREAVLKKKSLEIRKCRENTEQNILELTENIAKAKVSLQQTSQWVNVKFSHLLKVLEEKQELTESFVAHQQEALLSQAEARLRDLQEKALQLSELEEQIAGLCTLPHHQLIQDSMLIEVPQMGEVPVDVNVNVLEKLAPVTDVLSRISKMVCEDLDKAVYAAVGHNKEASPQDKRPVLAVVPSPATPSYTAGKEGLSAYRCSLTFDPRTANANLLLSQSNRRAEHLTSGPRPVPAHEARFDHTWQVLCFEKFTHGRHYWELEVSKPWAYVGVTYQAIPRKEKGRTGMLGMNELSWSLQLDERQLSAWHAGNKEPVLGQMQGQSQPLRIGMLLDYESGTLTYYSEGQVRLHAFHCVFTDELFPACWIGEGVSVTLCPP
ncbi:tripartite motif-containing protein 65 [Electrophorus electricus]|uniref:Tripartite motif containing 65 n=1 Tax=Electrophorus electricus TaxID=8005 RepID=A0A4W4HHE1_ELEEL|nr:tripartite motif-containing protein 65 [Electrophorus electricus]